MSIDGRAPRIKVGLVQINNSFSNQSYLPLSVGLLQAYSQHYLSNPDGFEFQLPIFSRIPGKDAVNQLLGADVAFSARTSGISEFLGKLPNK